MLYQSGITQDGVPLLAGIFSMKDQQGFPVDASLHECQQRGLCPDWAEYLADAGRHRQWKFDAACDELRFLLGDSLTNEIIQRFKAWGAALMRLGDTFIDACERMVEAKRRNATPVGSLLRLRDLQAGPEERPISLCGEHCESVTYGGQG